MQNLPWSQRVERIQPFYVMEILSRAARRSPERGSLVNLVVGEPDFPTPAPIVQAAQAALIENRIHYTSALGQPELRALIAQDYLKRDQVAIDPAQVVVTAGASAGLLLALAAVMDPGDEVLIPDPGYPCNRAFVEALGGVPRLMPLKAENAYQPTALDNRDPLGVTLSHVLREANSGIESVMTVQTYHVALALAHHGVGVALVESCTAASADLSKVDVLSLEPSIPVVIQALRPNTRPNSLISRAFTRCMTLALQQIR